MVYKSFVKWFLCFLCAVVSVNGFSQLSKKHYIPPLTSSEFGNANPEDQYIYISTPSTAVVPYTIIPVGQLAANYITGTVSNNTPRVISIGSGNGQLFVASPQTSQVHNNKGYIIEAEAPVYVSVRMNGGGTAQAGALVSKGASALGNTFRIGTYTNDNPQDNYLSFVSVMATEDNTQVSFSNLASNLGIENYTGGAIPINTLLNEGDSYIVALNSFKQTAANRDGLIGCLVTSDKPIVVNCGSANGSFHNGGGRDYGIDQIAGLSKVGREYIFVRGGGSNDWENILIVAHSDNTTISINGNAPVTTINAGDYYLIEGNNYSNVGNMYVETSQDVFAYQGVGGNGEANQGMFFVPPLSCETRGNIDNIANINNIGNTIYSGGVSIVTKVGASVTINNLPLSSFNTSGPNNVLGKSDYVTYQVTGLSGNVSIQGDDELYVAYFNNNGAATSGSFYSGFPTAPEINFDAQFVTLGNCIPNITLEAANAQNFDSYEWFYDDGSGFLFLEANVPAITPLLPGRYKLIGTITCTGETLESVEVPVSICPDDIDNDGIIDNLDVDNDNDGILNCTESRGDVVIDLTNLAGPVLNFQDGNTDASLATGSLSQTNLSGGTNTFMTDNQGRFTSSIPPTISGENTYTINFTEPININFSEDISIADVGQDKEFFIVSILPANKNITLVDPDDRLLIDSNFDGLFETGITQISGSEIRFRFNPSPNGDTPYQFYANQVEGFEFYHKSEDDSTVSSLSGSIVLTCFKKDTDGDGVKDELDLDSDNDGIPDFIERAGSVVTLSGADADDNGLDDIYDINFLPNDTDNDGVWDFYDLDSDNDGIYDLYEANPTFSHLLDTNFNGIEDGPSFGINGWTDRAETAPDSNSIDYVVNDADGDGIFSYLDFDSDGDSCSDVIEAGFSDGDNDNYLGDTTPVVDVNGVVTNTIDGYQLPQSDYLTSAPLSISIQPVDTSICLFDDGEIQITSNEAEFYQWEVSVDGINWNSLINTINYAGVNTNTLTITNTLASFNNNFYRVKLDLTGNSCGLYSDEVQLTILALPTVNNPSTYRQCDDESNDGQALFNLTLDWIKDEINPNHIFENLTFDYFENQMDAENKTNPMTFPEAYQNKSAFTNEVIWIRVENPNACYSVVPLTLEVNPSSGTLSAYNPLSIYQCDDGTNNRDGIATFDMTVIKDHITNIIFSSIPVTAHFYESQLDAELETNEIMDVSNHLNTNSPNAQSIWVRVKSDLGNDCLGLEEFSNLLIVESLPIANPVIMERQCDFDTTDTILSYPFDTSQLESMILRSQNPSEVTITYFDSSGNPLLYSDGSQVTSPIQPTFLSENQVIIVRVTNNSTNDPDGACYDETSIEFIIDEQPIIADPIEPQIFCDDGTDGTLENDGLHVFDLSSFSNIIKGTQSNMDIFFSYLDETGIAVSKATSLPNMLISGNQIIDVEVVNPINPNCNATTTIELIVNPIPEFSINEEEIVCTSDPTFTVVLDPTLVNSDEAFNYEWTFNGNSISNDKSIEVSIPGSYNITLTNPITLCSKTITVTVMASELANISLNDLTIVDISENNSITINNPESLGSGNYDFSLESDDRQVYFPYQDHNVFNNVRAGIYTLFVRDPICGIAELEVYVVGHRKFFTPNGDGRNDYWQIQGLSSLQAGSQIHIFDRYGKLIKQIDPFSQGWDGTYNGAMLPTDDYWFKVFLADGRSFMGHFALKR